MTKPIAVLISDTHYSLNTYKIADLAFRAAIHKAAQLGVPLIDLGDLTNDKAIIRGEVANTLIDTMEYAIFKGVEVVCLVGNHSLLNEKSKDHNINFLRPHAIIADFPMTYLLGEQLVQFIPYQSTNESFLEIFSKRESNLVFTHQGYKGAAMGDYVKDDSSVEPSTLGDVRIFSGHYHRHQTLGPVTYVGSPYTLTFGEANDGPKGFLILNDDLSFERVILPLRKHIIVEGDVEGILSSEFDPKDLIWFKLRGTESQLKKVKKSKLATLVGHENFKLDLISTESNKPQVKTDTMTKEQIFDALIEAKGENVEELKALWRSLI